MATGLASDVQIYDDQYHSGIVERVAQNITVFNQASQGTIRLLDNRLGGDYNKVGFLKSIANVVTRRDTTSVSAATVVKAEETSEIGVKINRKVGPIENTLDSFKKSLMDNAQGDGEVLSFLIGNYVADEMMADQVNTTLLAVANAIENQAAVKSTIAASGTMTSAGMIDGLALFGDAAGAIDLWVMHSKAYFDLMKEQVAAKITGISNFNLFEATPVTLNRPVLVVDAPGLAVTTGTGTAAVTDYYTLGLTANAAACINSEGETMNNEIVGGLENLVVRMQGEFAYNLQMKGFQWDTTNGGANPTDTALATGTNWDKVATSDKHLAGVLIQSR
jgi:hypothetical protein